jgi:hypothetical protein
MKRTFTVLGLTLLFVGVLDVAVAFTLNWAERTWRFGGLVQYFEYGRSVPGKLGKWQANPDAGYNLFNIGWRDEGVANSALSFASEAEGTSPVVRSYGMSFVNNVIKNAVALDTSIKWDDHAGPGVPPNYTFAYFEDDVENRREGDIAVFGILASTLPAMAAFSNQTWAFEQPAPLTYPIYQPNDGGLDRIDPLVTSAFQQAALSTDGTAAEAWADQLADHDAFFGFQTHGAPILDHSPLARLIRRATATSHVSKVKSDILRNHSYPYAQVLRQMIVSFALTARADGQVPIVMLIQDRNAGEADLLEIAKPILDKNEIRYIATAEHFDSNDPSIFLNDGHFKPQIDMELSAIFLKILEG